MNTECKPEQLEYQSLGRREVIGRFDGGRITSDGGGLLLREVDQRIGLLDRLVACFTDHRNPESIEHSVRDLVAQRVYGLALGYEDLNDLDDLRKDSTRTGIARTCHRRTPSARNPRTAACALLPAAQRLAAAFCCAGAELRRTTLQRNRSHLVLRHQFHHHVRHDVLRRRTRRSDLSHTLADARETAHDSSGDDGGRPVIHAFRHTLWQHIRLRAPFPGRLDRTAERPGTDAQGGLFLGRGIHPGGLDADHPQ